MFEAIALVDFDVVPGVVERGIGQRPGDGGVCTVGLYAEFGRRHGVVWASSPRAGTAPTAVRGERVVPLRGS